MSETNPFESSLEHPPENVEKEKKEGIDLSRFPIPEEDEKFKEATTDELFGALMLRIKKEKAKVMLTKAYDQFNELARRVNGNFAITVALEAIQELADGQVRAAHALENQKSSVVD